MAPSTARETFASVAQVALDTQSLTTFEPFPKLARLSRECAITEKIDGTNAQVYIVDLNEDDYDPTVFPVAIVGDLALYAGSRNRLIWPGKEKDNAGFAAWVCDNAQELVKLGPGRHFGEWWGKGIQRGYGLNEKRFSLFDPRHSKAYYAMLEGYENSFPKCCHVVPWLFNSIGFERVDEAMHLLAEKGSQASKGFMSPEGIVVWHSAARVAFKKTFENDATGKEAA